MEPKDILEKSKEYESQLLEGYKGDISKKYEIKQVFGELRHALMYRIPVDPIDISEDRMEFTCPTCKTRIESKDGTADEYLLCYMCGQLFKPEIEEDEDE